MLSESDKETVKRAVPKSANKIQAVAVARLYIAYPNRQRWVYTGLQGAAVLANDLVGNTFWIKLVDISVGTPSAKLDAHPAYGSRAATVVSYGTRRYMIHCTTTRTEPFFIPLNLKSASPVSHSWTRRRPRNSSRRWMIGRKMRARAPELHRSKVQEALSLLEEASRMESHIIAGSEV